MKNDKQIDDNCQLVSLLEGIQRLNEGEDLQESIMVQLADNTNNTIEIISSDDNLQYSLSNNIQEALECKFDLITGFISCDDLNDIQTDVQGMDYDEELKNYTNIDSFDHPSSEDVNSESISLEEETIIVNNEENAQNSFKKLFIQQAMQQASDTTNIDDFSEADEVIRFTENDSDNEVFHIVEEQNDGNNEHGNEIDENTDSQTDVILTESFQPDNLENDSSLNETVFYVEPIEEENYFEEMFCPKTPHPRSILKSSHPNLDKCSNRFSRNKEALQARQFINFINSTTIPQVPVRKERLPRKQQIKPNLLKIDVKRHYLLMLNCPIQKMSKIYQKSLIRKTKRINVKL